MTDQESAAALERAYQRMVDRKRGVVKPPEIQRLIPDQVLAIRDEYAAGGVSHADLARRYGRSETTIQSIVTRRRYKSVK